jgi:hypothetical protein
MNRMTMLAIMASLLVTHIAAFATAAFATLRKHDSVYRGRLGEMAWLERCRSRRRERMDGQRVGMAGGRPPRCSDLCLPQPLPPLDFNQPRLGKQLVLLTLHRLRGSEPAEECDGSR